MAADVVPLPGAAKDPVAVVLPGLGPVEIELLAQVFSDAVKHRTPGSWCDDCGEAPGTLCAADAADLDLADAYMGLAMALGIEVAR